MKKYLNIFSSLVKYSAAKDVTYPGDLVAEIFLSFFHLAIYLLTISFIFSRITEIAGWSKNEVLLLLGLGYFFRGLFVLFFRNGLDEISELIYNGSLDLLLVKPVSSIFLIGFSKINFLAIPQVVYGLFIAQYSLSASGIFPLSFSLLAAIIVGICGMIVLFSIYLSLMTIYFWTLESRIEELFSSLNIIGQYPLEIFSNVLRIIFSWLLPLSFLAYFPAKIILGKINLWEILLVFPVTLLVFFLGLIIWQWGLKSYTSASS